MRRTFHTSLEGRREKIDAASQYQAICSKLLLERKVPDFSPAALQARQTNAMWDARQRK